MRNYTKVMRYDKLDGIWIGHFAEMPAYKTSDEDGTLSGCSIWLDYLLDDLLVWESKGEIPQLPLPSEPENTIRIVIHFDEYYE